MKDVKFTQSFRFRLMSMLFLLIFIPVISLSFFVFTWFKDILASKISESAQQSIQQSARNIDFTLNNLLNYSNGMLTNRHFITLMKTPKVAAVDEIENMLRGFFTPSDGVEGLKVILGKETYAVGNTDTMVESGDDAWNRKLEASTGEVLWGRTQKVTIRNMTGNTLKYSFSVNRKLVDIFTMEQIGIIKMYVDETKLEESYSQQGSPDEVETLLCDTDGYIMSHVDKSRIGQNAVTLPYIRKAMGEKADSGWFNYKYGNRDAVVIYASVKQAGWRVIRIIPSSYLFQEVDNIRTIVVLAGGILLIAASLVALYFAQLMTRPITRLMRNMREAENGNLEVAIVVDRNDEIAQLSRSFSDMLAKIRLLLAKSIEEEKQKREIELEALHAQINPHFLYNTLNSIKWMAKMAGAQNISQTITALVKLLRISINMTHDKIPLKEEIEHVRNYVFIQKIRFNEQFEIQYDLKDDTLDCQLPKLILQPIVENAIVHGFEGDAADTLQIVIRSFKQDGQLVLEIEDDGIGIEEDVLAGLLKPGNVSKFSAVGLMNVNERIRLYCGDGYGLKVESRPGEGTLVRILLPVEVPAF